MEDCEICGCRVTRGPGYGEANSVGRSHASRHHLIPQRFLGGPGAGRTEDRSPLFSHSPWGHEDDCAVLCYDCHEELLHNPVLLHEQIETLAALCRLRGCNETDKTEDRSPLAARVQLLHEAIALGLEELLKRESG